MNDTINRNNVVNIKKNDVFDGKTNLEHNYLHKSREIIKKSDKYIQSYDPLTETTIFKKIKE